MRASSSACGHPPQGLREGPGPRAPSRAPRVPRGPSPLPSSVLPAPTCPAGPSSNASPLAASAFPLSSWNLPRGRHSSRLLPLAGNARTGSGVRTSLCLGTRAWRRQEPLRGWRTRRRGWVTSHGERTLAPSLPPAPGLRATTGPLRQLDSSALQAHRAAPTPPPSSSPWGRPVCAPLSRWTARLSPCPPCAPSGAHGTKCPRVRVHTCWQAPGRAWCWGRAGTWPRQACPLAGLDRAPRPPWEARACSGQPKTVTRATRSPGHHLFALLLGWPWVRSGCGVSEGPWPSAWSGGFGLSTLGFRPAGGAMHALGDARGARWGRGARGHCPCSSVPPRGSGPPQHAPGAWGKTSASCTSGPQGGSAHRSPGLLGGRPPGPGSSHHLCPELAA